MKVLVLGNGFDLAHDMATSYNDFFEFMNLVKPVLSFVKKDCCFDIVSYEEGDATYTLTDSAIDTINDAIYKIIHKNKPFCSGIDSSDDGIRIKYASIMKCIGELLFPDTDESMLETENAWYGFLDKKRATCNGNWSGIENEIRTMVERITNGEKEREEYAMNQIERWYNLKECALDFLTYLDNSGRKNEVEFGMEKELHQGFLIDILKRDYEMFVKLFEIYIGSFVLPFGLNENNRMDAISSFNPDSVICFNYTDTYRRVYNDKCKCYYVHGLANPDIDNCLSSNIVMGINEFLSDDRKEDQIEYMEYRKYYQRIMKDVDNNFMESINADD